MGIQNKMISFVLRTSPIPSVLLASEVVSFPLFHPLDLVIIHDLMCVFHLDCSDSGFLPPGFPPIASPQAASVTFLLRTGLITEHLLPDCPQQKIAPRSLTCKVPCELAQSLPFLHCFLPKACARFSATFTPGHQSVCSTMARCVLSHFQKSKIHEPSSFKAQLQRCL